MAIELQRDEAIARIACAQSKDMGARDRGGLLLDYWASLNEEESTTLPHSLREEMSRSDEPEGDVTDARYDPLITLALRHSLRGVRNSFLEETLRHIEGQSFLVIGNAEVLLACPCCGYQTLDRRGEYDICAVCFWEDDGNMDPERYSSVNHMTLKVARETFLRLGVSCEKFASKIRADSKKMYYHVDE